MLFHRLLVNGVSSSPLFWQTTLSEMAAGSLFRWGKISGFYTRLAVAQAEVSTAVSVICWDLDPCQWKKKILFVSSSSKETFWQLSIFLLLRKQCLPFSGDTKLRISPSLSPQDAWASIAAKAYSLAQSEQKLNSISCTCCQMGILRRLMTNKIHWFILNHCNQHFSSTDLF